MLFSQARGSYTHVMPEYIELVTTVEHRQDAQRIARTLVEKRLAACVHLVGPIESVYRWQGNIETTEEWQCRVKTRRDRYEAVEQAIRQIHPYQVPEILVFPIEAGGADYLAWLDDAVRSDE